MEIDVVSGGGDRNAVSIFKVSDFKEAYERCMAYCEHEGGPTDDTSLIYINSYDDNLDTQRILFDHANKVMYVDPKWIDPLIIRKKATINGILTDERGLPDWAQMQLHGRLLERKKLN